ncbi:MAG: hypothetical protein JXA14_16540 [Anaerolineae bacterium]|nr:hypothetical protein [Anaerolineae bacterium]
MADTIQLKTTYVDRQDPLKATMTYDRQLDTLYIKLDVFGGLHVAHYLCDGVYALFDPETTEIVGFQVEGWRRVFLRRHRDLRWRWYLYRSLKQLGVILTRPQLIPQPEGPILDTVKRYCPA